MDDVEQSEDLADPAAHDGQRGAWRVVPASAALDLEEGEGHRREHDVVRPAPIGAVSFTGAAAAAISWRAHKDGTRALRGSLHWP